MLEEIVQQIIAEYCKLDEVEAITIAGSRASNRNDEQSDIDIDLFITAPIEVSKRREIAMKFSSEMEINNQFFGTGDEFILRELPIEIDVCFFDWEEILLGLDRVMQKHQASCGYSTCFVHNVTKSHIVFDRHGNFAKTQQKYQNVYPKELKQNIIQMNYPILRDSFSSYYHQIEKAIKREDLNSVNHRLTAFLASYYDIIFAVNEMFHPGEKRLISIIETTCPKRPQAFKGKIESLIFSLGQDTSRMLPLLNELVDDLDQLLTENRS